VSIHYDPLIAKVIAHAETRELAIARLSSALRQFPILGVRTNVEYLIGIVTHDDFRRGRIDTGFLDRHADALAPPVEPVPAFVRAAANAHQAVSRGTGDLRSSWDPWRP
jgi:3-methylcrotonyl-CoA carboxylase alpha subunit